MKDKLIEEFKDILELEDETIEAESNFRDYDDWDSIAALSVMAYLDSEFNFSIKAEDFKQINTINQLVALMNKNA
ncbi:acyl carrier protein [Psychroflexus gondwanensis]|jgi:acyl carrier protein|uniref:acyl carrier protein n=1 Tax=Psychroflexus gondwanensis TaxID=251 RepID=UPI0011BF9B5A|nr:acyl carrier protein [Psychroflexus gondwanensis]TXE19198.1 acyl carrier protein [Psychroflexus gondwanensis]